MPFLLGAPLPVSNKPFDPSTLALSGWWRAPYSSAPLAGTASAGISGISPMSVSNEASTGLPQPTPTTGTALSGKATMLFNGVDQTLISGSLTQFISTSWTSWSLFRVLAVSLSAANAWNNHPMWQDDGQYLGLYAKKNGSAVDLLLMQDYGVPVTINAGTVALNSWVLVGATFDGTTMHVDCGAGDVSAASGIVASASGPVLIGGSKHNARPFGNIEVAELMFASAANVGTRAQIKSYLSARYGISPA